MNTLLNKIKDLSLDINDVTKEKFGGRWRVYASQWRVDEIENNVAKICDMLETAQELLNDAKDRIEELEAQS